MVLKINPILMSPAYSGSTSPGHGIHVCPCPDSSLVEPRRWARSAAYSAPREPERKSSLSTWPGAPSLNSSVKPYLERHLLTKICSGKKGNYVPIMILDFLQIESSTLNKNFFKGESILIFFSFSYVRYSILLHLPPLRFHCVGGCRDRTQDSLRLRHWT